MQLDLNALITGKILLDNGGGGGGSGITKIAEKEFTVSTTSTSAIEVGTVDCGEIAWNAHKLLFVVVKDKVGKRNGHFYCSNSAYSNASALIGGGFSSDSPKFFRCIAVNDDGSLKSSSSAYGVYDTMINDTGSLTIKAKYSSTNTLTIDGTYVVSVYLIDIDPFPGA